MKMLLKTVLGMAVALGTQAHASTTFQIGNGGLETFNLTWDNHTENALAGAIILTKVSGTLPTTVSVCTDIGGTVFLGGNYVYSDPLVFNNQDGLVPTWGSGNGGIARDALWASLSPAQQNNARAAINAAADIFQRHQSVLTGGTITQKAALQLAVWEALLDTTFGGTPSLSFSQGRFKVNSGADTAAISLAETYVGEVNYAATYSGFLLQPTDRTAQEMLYNITPLDPLVGNLVPEPSTYLAGALLLLPFAASTLRRQRQKLPLNG